MNEERLQKLLEFLDKAVVKSGVDVLVRNDLADTRHRQLTRAIVAYANDGNNLPEVKVAFRDWLGAIKG